MPVWSQSDPARPRSSTWQCRLVATVAGVALTASVLGGPAAAQDGTSGAPPLEETGCRLVPASPMEEILRAEDASALPVEDASPVAAASPAADASPVPDGATPVADTSPVPERSTPEASPSPEASGGAFNEDLLLEDLTEAATSLTSCLTEGRFADVAQRTSPLFRGQLIGVPEPVPAEVFGSLAQTFPTMTYSVVEIGSPFVVDPAGTATAQIVWQVGHQIRVDQWTFIRSEVQGVPMWTVDRAEPGTIDPEIDAQAVEVTIADNRYELEIDTVEGDAVRFEATNTDGTVHELLVLRLDEGAETSQLLTTHGPALPAGFTFIGQATIPADASGQLLLVDLEPGRYAIVNLLLDENGLPRLAGGMEAAFEVQP